MIHNLAEEHVLASYESLRARFPEFCGCDLCREDALVYTLNRVPPRYVASRTGSVLTEMNLEKDQSRAAIDVAMPLIVAAVRARATLGEISDALREVWGVYRSA